MEDEHDTDDLHRIAPLLTGIPRTDPFVTPPGFHERFAREMEARLARTPAPPAWRVRPLPWAVAVSAAAVLIAGRWMLRTPSSPGTDATAFDALAGPVAAAVWEDDLLHALADEGPAALAPAPEAPALAPDVLAEYYELTGTDVVDLIEPI